MHHTANDTMAQVDPQALRQSVAAFATSVWLGSQFSGQLGARHGREAAAALNPAIGSADCEDTRHQAAALFGVHLLEGQPRCRGHGIQHRMGGTARKR